MIVQTGEKSNDKLIGKQRSDRERDKSSNNSKKFVPGNISRWKSNIWVLLVSTETILESINSFDENNQPSKINSGNLSRGKMLNANWS
jgi:hypothetical protein